MVKEISNMQIETRPSKDGNVLSVTVNFVNGGDGVYVELALPTSSEALATGFRCLADKLDEVSRGDYH